MIKAIDYRESTGNETTMKRKNCWEVKKCGRHPGAENSDTLGVCPAALSGKYDGINMGECAGRFCWAVAGTLCCGRVQGTYAMKFMSCLHCDFLKLVNEEEGIDFILTPKSAESELKKKQ